MNRRDGRREHPDEGSAVVEFVTLGVLLLLPLVYLIVAAGRVQAATYAADGSARAAARAFVAADDERQGEARAVAAVRLGLLDQGFDRPGPDALRLDCSRTPCLSPQGVVTATVQVEVVLPGVPAFVDRAIPAHVTVRARQAMAVDAFRSTGGGP